MATTRRTSHASTAAAVDAPAADGPAVIRRDDYAENLAITVADNRGLTPCDYCGVGLELQTAQARLTVAGVPLRVHDGACLAEIRVAGAPANG